MQAFDNIFKNVGSADYGELFTNSQRVDARRKAQEFMNAGRTAAAGLGAIGEQAKAAGQAALQTAGGGSQKSADPFGMFLGVANLGLDAARRFKNRGVGGGGGEGGEGGSNWANNFENNMNIDLGYDFDFDYNTGRFFQ